LKERERLQERRAFSTVLSVLIISAVVLAVGGGIWAFSQSAMTISSEDYAESVINMTDTISERFIVEQVFYYPDTNILRIWIFNYGTVDIEVKVQVKDIICPSAEDEWIEIPSKDMKPFPTINLDASSREELNIKAYTKRGNNAYYKFFVP